ncbi:hypothetical protein Acsp04_62260 [Actinomadura sp. NBRC 104425]|uniref:hypothetical protein n=1 Tax=Actinomadura sp. NBRC 104425 TaxID=3032204 RepID=UPI0024A5C1A5|nr:hypothetical protein [Actinomadura sp. NBRC 104425]GLZ15991.1 hypothetical protein Acsp04_62260 [Actinomadura sp. NBRC 104425]
MSDTVIYAISLGVTALGLLISWGLYRRRGAASGLRGAAWSLVPLAAAMTGVTGFLADLAFSPAKWAGVAVAGLAVLLYLTSGAMLSRRAGGGGRAVERGGGSAGAAAAPKGRAVEKARPAEVDPEMAEIEQILRNRGIQ